MALHFLLLSLLLGTSLTPSRALDVSFTARPSTIALGQPFIATCTVTDSSGLNANGQYEIDIEQDGANIAVYTFHEAIQGQPRPPPTIYVVPSRTLTVSPLWNNDTVIQVSITPKNQDAHKYSCYLKERSNLVPITVVEKLPSAHFQVNVTRPQVGVPFSATCLLANFTNSHSINYQVKFYSARDGLLATYELGTGPNLLQIPNQVNLTVHEGARAEFPNFDLTIIEIVHDPKPEYWCELVEPTYGAHASNRWSDGPLVKFTSVRIDETQRLGTCSIGNFDPVAFGKVYSVLFATSMGTNDENVLATYIVRPSKILELDLSTVDGWVKIGHGSSVAFPEFSLLGSSNSFQGDWWCVLVLGEESSTAHQTFKSDVVSLA